MVFDTSRSKVGVETARPVMSKRGLRTKPKKKRRTKGPSEKIRSLAALSLAPKVGYLKLTDLIGPENAHLQSVINDRLEIRVFDEGESIYPTNEATPRLFWLKSGLVDIFRLSKLGQRFDVKRLEPGAIFGEAPLLGQTMLGSRAEAAENSEIAIINSSDFEMLAAASPSIALNIVRQLGPRLVEAEKRHEMAAFQPVTARIASLLIKLSNRSNQVTGYTHQEFADMLGVYRETVTNALLELKHDKLIQVGRKRITLLDPDGLRRLESF